MVAPTFDEYAARASAKYPGIGEAQIREAYQAKYNRAPVRSQGPTRDEYAARARAKYPDISDDQISQAYEAKYGAGFGTELKRTLTSQVVAPAARGTGAILGGLDRLFGDVPGTGLFDRAGEALFNYGEEAGRLNAPSADLQSRPWYSPRGLTVNTTGALGQMLAQIGTGGSGIVALQLDEAARLEEEILRDNPGMSPAEARTRAITYAMVSGGLERTGLGRLMPTRLPGRIKAGAQEAATEIAQGVARNVAADEPALENIGETVTKEGLPAFLAAAILAPSGRQRTRAADDFAREAGLDEGVPRETPTAPDRAGPEPLRDLEAQVKEVGKSRGGVYVSPANRGFTVPNLVELETPDGGALLVREEDAPAAQAELAGATDEATRQAVIGKWTGAGAGKPLDPNARVVQAIRNGAVIRETVVPEAEAEATAKRMGAELKVPTRVVTAQEALARRQRIIENEDQSPFKALGEEELLRRTDPEEARRRFEEQVRARPIPPRPEIPQDIDRLFETTETSALVPVEELVPTKERRTSSGALKFMQATGLGEAPKHAPLKVRVDGTGKMLVEDGNGTLGASKFLKFPQVPADIELTTTTPKGKAYERRLTPEARVELSRLARDAEAYLPEFRQTLENIAEAVTGTRASNTKTVGALVPKIKSNGSKGWDRIAEKVVAEDGGNWRNLKDMARATILVENKEQAQQALDAVLEAFGQAPGTKIRRSLLDANSFDDVKAMDPYGYGDIKVNVNGPNGRVYEVQITTPGLFDAKENGPGHDLYEAGREREGKVRDALKKIVGRRLSTASPDDVLRAVDAAVKMFRGRDATMQTLYGQSQTAYGQAWERFFASSAQSARQAASEMASPSARTDEGVTGMNTPESSALNATSPEMTAGDPSTLKNSFSAISPSSITGGIVATNIAPHKIAAPSGRIIEARPVFVEMDALLTSDMDGYPAQFQPRERGKRAGLSAQVQKIARELTPWLLGVSNSTGSGAPIVGPGNLVESGNGRTLALRLAREQFPENFAEYQAWVRAEAERLGADVSGMRSPILVQERMTALEPQEVVDFTIDANRDEKASMSPTELARADSTVLSPEMLTLLRSGDLSQAQNQDFMAEFLARIPNGQSLLDARGKANAQAIERAEAAIVAKAYGADRGEVSELLDRLYETADEGVRRITNALKLASFRWAELRLALENGIVTPDYDLSGELMLAYNQVREGRLKGLTAQQIQAQGDLTMTPERAAFVDAFYKADGKEQPTEVIAAQLIYTAQQAAAQRTDQGSFFDERVPPADIARNAVNLIGRNDARSDIGKDGQFVAARSTWPKPGGLQAWAVNQTLARMMDKWNPDLVPAVRIVQSAGDLPQNVLAALGPDINGATDIDNGVVYLVADNLRSIEDAERVIIHEVIGHYGFMRLWGERWPKLVEDIIRLADQDGSIKRVRDDILRRYPKLQRDHLAAEIVAHVAETRPKHPFAKRIVAAFRDLLRRMGFKVNLSRNDMVYLIRRAADAMKDPAGGGYKGPRDGNLTYRSPRVDAMNSRFASRGERDGKALPTGGRVDQFGRPIPEGQQDIQGLDTGEQRPQQAPDFALERPEGQVNPPSQARLFASRPEGPAGPTGMGFQGPPGATAAAPPPGDRGIDVGGGSYSLAQYGRLTDQEMNVLQSVMRDMEGRIEGERGGREPQTWDATERQALDLIRNQTGLVLDSLVNRKPGSTANASQLEAYAQVIVKLNRQVTQVAQRIAATRNPSSEDLAELAQLRERLGMMLAPAMGYATEAGRALNILRKVAGDLRTADDVLARLGDGSENTLKDFAKRVIEAEGDINKVVGITRASYTPTWWDKFYEYWINGILSGPTTHSVNIVSNAMFQVLESVAELGAAAVGRVDARSAAARLASVPHGVTLGLKNARTAWVEERAVLTPEDKLESDRHAIGGTLGKVIRTPGRALQAEDEFFKAIAYQGALSALAMDEAVRKNKADPMDEHARIMGNILGRPDLIRKAKDQAARVTFTTPLGPIGQAVTNVLNRSKVGRLIVPFVRTPTNILKRALEYTPAAPAFAEVRAQLAGGGRDEAMAWSRMAVGSSIMVGVAALAAQGLVSGAGPDDEAERAQLMRQGWRPYSVKIPGLGWVKYNRFEPTGMLLGLAADMSELAGAMNAGEYDAIASMLVTSLASNLGDKTFLRGITDFASAYSDPQRYMERWAQGMLASPIPNVIAQTTRWLDPYQREARSMMDTIKSRLPGASEQLAKRLDLAGEPIQRDSGAPGNPFQVSAPREDALARAMLELGVQKNAVSRRLAVGGQSYELEGADYESYKGYVQKARWNVLTPVVNSPQFRALKAQNPLAAQALLERQYDEVGRQARMAWIMRNPQVLTDPKKRVRSPTALSYELQ
jgi:hypothetical protein